jgi:hypothetical protein
VLNNCIEISSVSVANLVKKLVASLGEYMGCICVRPGWEFWNGKVHGSTAVALVAGNGPTMYSCQCLSVELVVPL